MRMWMLSPNLLCNKHLIAEHGEIHAAVGNLVNGSGKWAKSLIHSGYLEPASFRQRHNEIVQEMLRRGYNHNSPLIDFEPNGFSDFRVDRMKSLHDLIGRCEECRQNIIGGEK